MGHSENLNWIDFALGYCDMNTFTPTLDKRTLIEYIISSCIYSHGAVVCLASLTADNVKNVLGAYVPS